MRTDKCFFFLSCFFKVKKNKCYWKLVDVHQVHYFSTWMIIPHKLPILMCVRISNGMIFVCFFVCIRISFVRMIEWSWWSPQLNKMIKILRYRDGNATKCNAMTENKRPMNATETQLFTLEKCIAETQVNEWVVERNRRNWTHKMFNLWWGSANAH